MQNKGKNKYNQSIKINGNHIIMNLIGHILISMPNMLDERFYKSVIYLCAHSKEGSMGIIINKNIVIKNRKKVLHSLAKGFHMGKFIG